MDYEAYRRDLLEAAEMFEAGQVKEAAQVFRAMATNLDLPLPDRAISLSNLGRALTKLGRLDEAEAAYNEGIAVEDRLLRGIAREEKAAWLVERGRSEEAVTIYEWLSGQYWIDAGQRERCRRNLATLRNSD